ncbi:uncharacterized protein E0L32_008478 [Thyridium curvatum]|uniref:Uncharacterized protein n=1 Tax=Thyridium curvatum TaxID=1093900 RepID=A0A507ALJ5_9PEZI|nr:uncharacterized protein E0L32_008478 [Thyridium curvatum]TPX10592.1 hypothetical protein E0L32_008478 [Thyridium curvatum]
MEFEEAVMECNIPELLARDLEMSQSIFTSKHMTAGAPSLDTFSHDAFGRCHSLGGDVGCPAGRPSSQRPIARVQSSGALAYRYSGASNDEDLPRFGSVSTNKHDSWGFSSGSQRSLDDGESSSDNASESSGDVEPPPFRHRQYSVTTPATSVASARCSSLSHKPFVAPTSNDHSGSWLDFEPEIVILSDSRTSIEMDTSTQRPQTSSAMSAKELNRLSQNSAWSIPIPQRRSSLSHQVTVFSDDGSQADHLEKATLPDDMKELRIPISHTYPPMRPSFANSGDHMANVKVVRVQSPPQKPVLVEVNRPSQDSERATLSLLHDQDDADRQQNERALALAPPRTSHTEPHAAIQSWLDSSTDSPFLSPMVSDRAVSDDLGRGVPIPLKVVDSLKTSIHGFPVTLLTTSSFSIETIRSYSRKIKIPSGVDRPGGAQAFPILPISSPVASRRFKLSKLFTSRKALSEAAKAPFLGRGGDPSRRSNRASFTSNVPTAAFARLKCIFPNGSDYLCDALYAHLLAYNYIYSAASTSRPSFLLPSNDDTPAPSRPATAATPAPSRPATAATPAPSRPATAATQQPSPSMRSDDGRNIPFKAAQFLGIPSGSASDYLPASEDVKQDEQQQTSASARSIPRSATAGGQPPSGRTPGNRGPSKMDTPQEILDGLQGCIARLVATLKMPVGRHGEQPKLTAHGPRDIDGLFLNALCEIVRCCEDMN